ncbi:replication initiation factor domain-containing protein [Virgibacillus salarius]|nr:replication initiation factor domain-containing protein [Virgibacillus salarius]WBX82317.1 replication initiation factor domain-containing protein [Virgibacillus salarius]
MEDGSTGGTTIYFGSKKIGNIFVLLRKKLEQAEKYNKPLEDFPEWNRYELRLKNDRAPLFYLLGK